MYTIITENDESQWDDKTGELYHFPNKYLRLLQPGTKVIYYKGTLKNKAYENKRLTNKPHYFGYAEINNLYEDSESQKKDWYAEIVNFHRFNIPVFITDNNSNYLEIIPESKASNYWRDGVRPISKNIYEKILASSDLSTQEHDIQLNDDSEKNLESIVYTGKEGKEKKSIYNNT